jgi:RNA-directed DNA polymerase
MKLLDDLLRRLPPKVGERAARTGTAVMHFEDAFAPASLAEAWRKVRTNGGAPGPDKQSVEDFEHRLEQNLSDLGGELRSGRYRPQAALRVWLPKNGGEPGDMRPISILNVRDRVVQRAAHAALAPFYEQRFLDCSYGFRESRGVKDAVAQVTRLRDAGLRWVVDGDIRKCFESLEHSVLLRLLERDLGDVRYVALIERWLRAGVLGAGGRRGPVEVQERGVSQGAAISPLLANVYLHEFDAAMSSARRALVRYADDWVILCRSQDEAERALEEARGALAKIKLIVNPHKTRITEFDAGWSFLGAFFVKSEQYWVK